MNTNANLARTLLSYRTFEIIGAGITLIAVGVSVYIYLESLRDEMSRLTENVDSAYKREETRDAAWLVQDENDMREIIIRIDDMESGLIEYIGTGRDDEAWQRGKHEGHHETLSHQLSRIEIYLNNLSNGE